MENKVSQIIKIKKIVHILKIKVDFNHFGFDFFSEKFFTIFEKI